MCYIWIILQFTKIGNLLKQKDQQVAVRAEKPTGSELLRQVAIRAGQSPTPVVVEIMVFNLVTSSIPSSMCLF